MAATLITAVTATPMAAGGVIRTVVTATPMAAGATRTVDMAILMAVGVTQVGEHLLW